MERARQSGSEHDAKQHRQVEEEEAQQAPAAQAQVAERNRDQVGASLRRHDLAPGLVTPAAPEVTVEDRMNERLTLVEDRLTERLTVLEFRQAGLAYDILLDFDRANSRLEALAAAAERVTTLEGQLGFDGHSLSVQGDLTVNGALKVEGGKIEAPSGHLEGDTVNVKNVVAECYTPGAGNVW